MKRTQVEGGIWVLENERQLFDSTAVAEPLLARFLFWLSQYQFENQPFILLHPELNLSLTGFQSFSAHESSHGNRHTTP